MITTDGMENASREFTKESVKKMVEHQQQKYSWEFLFVGAPYRVLLAIPLQKGNIRYNMARVDYQTHGRTEKGGTME